MRECNRFSCTPHSFHRLNEKDCHSAAVIEASLTPAFLNRNMYLETNSTAIGCKDDFTVYGFALKSGESESEWTLIKEKAMRRITCELNDLFLIKSFGRRFYLFQYKNAYFYPTVNFAKQN